LLIQGDRIEANQNNERNGQLAEEIADAQASNENMEADYDVEQIGQLDEETMEPELSCTMTLLYLNTT
jgi:hypothetical protein